MTALMLSCQGEMAQAQQVDSNRDAQLLLQQQREMELQRQQQPDPSVRIDRDLLPAGEDLLEQGETPCFKIERIVFEGEDLARFGGMAAAAGRRTDGTPDPAVGQCLGTKAINSVLARVQNALIAAGYVTTRVFLPSQNLSEGTLKMTVVPGRVRAIRFAPGTSVRANWRNALPVREGDILNLRDIEQGLENFKRVPTADADIRIEPADAQGESDLVVTWQQAFPFRVNLSIDDGGSPSTGRYQGVATVSYDHPLTLNDLLYVSVNQGLADRGGGTSEGHSMYYGVPWGPWHFAFNTNAYQYAQNVVGRYEAYTYSGTSQSTSVTATRTLYRDNVNRVNVNMGGWTRRSDSWILDAEIEAQRRRTRGWLLSLDWRRFIGRATATANVSWQQGKRAHGGAPRAPEEAHGQVDSRLRMLSVDAGIDWPWRQGRQSWRYRGTLRAQWNATPLVVQDRFSIGGRHTVRGFSGQNTLMGERGALMRNELGLALGESGHEAYVALDYGTVGGFAAGEVLGSTLVGTALGLRGRWQGMAYDVFVGTPIHYPGGFPTDRVVGGFSLNYAF